MTAEIAQEFLALHARLDTLHARRCHCPALREAGAAPGHVLQQTERERAQSEVQRQAGELHRAHDELVEAVSTLEARVKDHIARLIDTNKALERSRQQLETFSRRLLEAHENECQAIAHELHNDTGQLLTTLIVGLGTLERHYERSEGAGAQIAYLQRIADEIMVGIHRLGSNLLPPSLDKLGLAAALNQLVQELARTRDLDLQFASINLDEVRLPAPVETTLYRVVQHALYNAFRHARAQTASVLAVRTDHTVKVLIEDDGVGFDLDGDVWQDGLGLQVMRQRVEALEGTFAVESAPGAGTTVFVEVPLSH